MMEEYYTVDEVAKVLKVTRQTVYDWMRSGRLEYVIVGDRRRISQSALQAFIKKGNPADIGETEQGQYVPGLAFTA